MAWTKAGTVSPLHVMTDRAVQWQQNGREQMQQYCSTDVSKTNFIGLLRNISIIVRVIRVWLGNVT